MSIQAADALMGVFGFKRVTLRGDVESGTTEAHELESGMTLTDELLAELDAESIACCKKRIPMALNPFDIAVLLSERAELKRDAERYRHYRKGMAYPEAFDAGIDQSMERYKC